MGISSELEFDLSLPLEWPGPVHPEVPGGWDREPEGATPDPVRVGGDVRPPRKLLHVPPSYPAAARLARIEGDVVLEALIDPQGNVVNLVVVRSVPLLDPSALDAVRQWKYQPTRLNGVTVPIVLSVSVSFRLR
ncbi:MAG: energy transducer TonB [Acidobacteria bacterium]|nr:energy transducer TonB [Acidobacteriota bacterium]